MINIKNTVDLDKLYNTTPGTQVVKWSSSDQKVGGGIARPCSLYVSESKILNPILLRMLCHWCVSACVNG